MELRGAMNERIGIWIDHKRAVIVSTSADRATATTRPWNLKSDLMPVIQVGQGTRRLTARRTEEARKNTRNATISILTGTMTKSSVSWVNPKLF